MSDDTPAPPDEISDERLQQLKMQQLILWFGLLSSPLVLFAVSRVVTLSANEPLPQLVGLILLGFVVMEAPVWFVLRTVARKGLVDGGLSEASVVRYNGLWIASTAIAEGAALTGIVLGWIGCAPPFAPPAMMAVGFALLALSRPNVDAHIAAARSERPLGGGAAALLVALLLVPAAAADPGAHVETPAQAAARAVDGLIALQRKDGSLRERRPTGFKLYERHSVGAHGVAGLAILAQRGDCPALRRLTEYILSRQTPAGCLAWRASKQNLEHAFCTQLLLELLLADARGVTRLPAGLRGRLDRAARMAVLFLLRDQHPGGGWSYGAHRGYLESATWVPVMGALLLAGRQGIDLPTHTLTKALAYLQTRTLPDGYLNGEKEVIVSPHAGFAVLSILEALPRDRLSSQRALGWRVFHVHAKTGYFERWGYEPTDPERDQFAKLKLVLGARRHLYGLYYRTLCVTRHGDPSLERLELARIARHLLPQRRGALWSSTAGEVASTSLAVLSLSAPQRRLALYGPLSPEPPRN